jgi:hypothetical protein
MKKVMFILVLLNWLLIGSPPSQAVPVLSFIPSTRDIGLGEVRTVELQIAGVFPPKLGAFDIFIDFDPAIVSFKPSASSFGGPLVGDQLACPGLPSICTNFGSIGAFILVDSDTLELFEVSLAPAADLDSYQAVTFALAQLAFEGLAKGTSTLRIDLANSVFADSLGDAITTVSARDGLINVNVPQPPGWLLFLTGGLVVFAFVTRRIAVG